MDRVIIVGDFNVHMDYDACNATSEFFNIVESFNFIQYVSVSGTVRVILSI